MPEARLVSLNTGTKLTLKASATLVLDGGLRMLVDPGPFVSLDEIDEALNACAGFGLAQINAVYFTHLHFDHYRHLPWGEHVEHIYMPAVEYDYVSELMTLRNDERKYIEHLESTHEYIAPVFLRQFVRSAQDSRYRFDQAYEAGRIRLLEPDSAISAHVETLALDGHCAGQLGLKVTTAEGLAIIAGDAALSLEDFESDDHAHHLIMFDAERWRQSRRKLYEADYVVPGHGPWFSPKTGAPFNTAKE